MVGVYTEYLNMKMDLNQLTQKRKEQLKHISDLRKGRDIIVYASDLMKGNVQIPIDYSDLLPFQDQLSYLNGDSIDIILETPGGLAEVVEDLVSLVRKKYEKVGVIIPGYAKSAGTIWAMAADEILMGPASGLGPIDAQILADGKGKRFSADAFLQGLEKIKKEVEDTKKLNPAYIPILQNISPGEIQHCRNAQDFSKKLVTKWLVEYKFKYWKIHSSTGKEVTKSEKEKRAEEIAGELCKHSRWLTHGRSIKIDDFINMKLKITDYSKNQELNDAIFRYYTLMRMSFDTNVYKIVETSKSQIYRFVTNPLNQSKNKEIDNTKLDKVVIEYQCPKCSNNLNSLKF